MQTVPQDVVSSIFNSGELFTGISTRCHANNCHHQYITLFRIQCNQLQCWSTLPNGQFITLQSVVHTFISCRLDYCNALLYGIADGQLQRLQSVQNAAARLVTGTRLTTLRRFSSHFIGCRCDNASLSSWRHWFTSA